MMTACRSGRRRPAQSAWRRFALAGALAAALAVGAAACVHQQPRQAGPTAVVVVRCPVRGASLWVDGRFVGPLADLRGGVTLRAGTHRIEVRDDGYHSYYGELTLAPKQRRQLRVELARAFP